MIVIAGTIVALAVIVSLAIDLVYCHFMFRGLNKLEEHLKGTKREKHQ